MQANPFAADGATRSTEVQGRSIVLTRLLDAPPALVWDALTDPEQVAEWWGPEGFGRNTVHAMDVRPGGTWHYTMHGPDGTDYDNLITYEEVEPHRLLRYAHGSSDNPRQFEGHITLEEVDGRTRLVLRITLPDVAALEAVVRDRGAIEGGNGTLDKLEAHLARKQA